MAGVDSSVPDCCRNEEILDQETGVEEAGFKRQNCGYAASKKATANVKCQRSHPLGQGAVCQEEGTFMLLGIQEGEDSDYIFRTAN
jgi:hypothetical protein